MDFLPGTASLIKEIDSKSCEISIFLKPFFGVELPFFWRCFVTLEECLKMFPYFDK